MCSSPTDSTLSMLSKLTLSGLPEANLPLLTEFHKFPKLPTELQLQIWRAAYATQVPRSIVLAEWKNTKAKGNQHVEGQTYTPAILQVCKLSREECMPLYTQLLETTTAPDFPKVPVYVNLSVDKLRLEWQPRRYSLWISDKQYEYNFRTKDVILDFQHFEIVYDPKNMYPSSQPYSPLTDRHGNRLNRPTSKLPEYYHHGIRAISYIIDDLATMARKPVLSITVVVVFVNQYEMQLYKTKLSEADVEEEKTKIREKLGRATKWETVTIEHGPLKGTPANTMVHPLKDTEVFLKYEVDKKKTGGRRRRRRGQYQARWGSGGYGDTRIDRPAW